MAAADADALIHALQRASQPPVGREQLRERGRPGIGFIGAIGVFAAIGMLSSCARSGSKRRETQAPAEGGESPCRPSSFF